MNKLQEVIIKGLKNYYGDSLTVPTLSTEAEARAFIQANSSDIFYGASGLISGIFVSNKDLLIDETHELYNEELIALELGIDYDVNMGLIDIWDDRFNEIFYYKANGLEVPAEYLEKVRKADEEYNKRMEEEAKYYEELERLACDNYSDYEDVYYPGDDYETDYINSLE